ncbi:hypothetical protein N9H93_02790 [Rhizobiaceae bacterium]|nr:hypothetical protein [Rhizobiaceae bacterium]
MTLEQFLKIIDDVRDGYVGQTGVAIEDCNRTQGASDALAAVKCRVLEELG